MLSTGAVTVETLIQSGVAVGLVVVVGLLYLQRPPVTYRTLLALLPWVVSGSALHALYGLGAYPPELTLVLRAPWVYLLVAVVAGLAWTLLLQVSETRTASERVPYYLGSMGLGVVLVPFTLVVWTSGAAVDPVYVGLLLLSPVLAGVVAVVLLIAFGAWFPDVTTYTGYGGALVVFGHTLDGVVTTVELSVVGPAGETPYLLGLAGGAAPAIAAWVGVSPALAATWLLLWLRIAVAVGVVVLLGSFVREAPAKVHVALGLVAAVGLVAGTHELLVGLMGGVA